MADHCAGLFYGCALCHASWPGFNAARLQTSLPARRLRIRGLRYRCPCHFCGSCHRSLCALGYLECLGYPEELDLAHQKASELSTSEHRVRDSCDSSYPKPLPPITLSDTLLCWEDMKNRTSDRGSLAPSHPGQDGDW